MQLLSICNPPTSHYAPVTFSEKNWGEKLGWIGQGKQRNCGCKCHLVFAFEDWSLFSLTFKVQKALRKSHCYRKWHISMRMRMSACLHVCWPLLHFPPQMKAIYYWLYSINTQLCCATLFLVQRGATALQSGGGDGAVKGGKWFPRQHRPIKRPSPIMLLH